LIIVDVWPSPASYPVFRFLHPEPLTLSIRPLDLPTHQPLFNPGNPWNSDQGIVRAIFWKQATRLRELFPALRIIRRTCFSTVLWPLSGGFEQKNRVPRFAEGWLRRLERLLEPWGRYLGFRSLVAVERIRA